MRLAALVWQYLRLGIMSEIQYRVNFVVQLVQSVIALGTGLIVLRLVFSYTTDLRGWTHAELLAVMGVHILVGGIVRASIQPNMLRLMEDVQEGTLDFLLAKPEDAQILVSIRVLRFWQAVDILLGLIVLLAAVDRLRGTVGPMQGGAFVLLLILGAVMIYSFWLMLTTGAFWIVRMENVIELFQGLYQAGRWPVGVYPDALRLVLTFLVPIGFAVTVPAEALTARLTAPTLAGAAALAAIFSLLARGVWLIGLRAYTGASA